MEYLKYLENNVKTTPIIKEETCCDNKNIINGDCGPVCINCGLMFKSTEMDDMDYIEPEEINKPLDACLPNYSMNTTISMGKNTRQTRKLRTLHKWSINGNNKETGLINFFRKIKGIDEVIGPKLFKVACYYFSLMVKESIYKGNNRKRLFVLCIVIANENMNYDEPIHNKLDMESIYKTMKTSKLKYNEYISFINDIYDGVLEGCLLTDYDVEDLVKENCVYFNYTNPQRVKLLYNRARQIKLFDVFEDIDIVIGFIYYLGNEDVKTEIESSFKIKKSSIKLFETVFRKFKKLILFDIIV